ncbi:polyhydroxyalkanoic acid system family protein [Pseudomonas typographi]|uniref:polyhydroxyalkanoic acid system family protein n=1 Tax=Pseudomonas typographi TaxID=2715964 RepID=UPI0016841600|nr:polyhydroxyalkanoic acid system family protein [Pseudomonas typographi]MBD1551847.1 polyhydroxyalkanoic acid system protein [Pseudomonas typographi]
MSQITVVREHQLGYETARERAEKLVEKLVSKYDMQAAWDGDTVQLKRSGMTGQVQVAADTVQVDLTLSTMLSMMGGVIETEIGKALDKYLA